MKPKVTLAACFVTLLLLATACGPTHATVAAALAGSSGDRAELSGVVISTDVVFRPRADFTGARDYLEFTVCEGDDCVYVEVIPPGSWPERGDTVNIIGGRLQHDDVGIWIRANAVHIVQRAANSES